MRQIPFREAIREAMNEEMRRDERVFLMGEEVAEYNGAYKVSQGMLAEFGPRRVIDTPISELGFTAVAVGAAQNGLRPVVEYMTWNFAVLALDQILNTASKMLAMSGGQISCPIVFRGANGSAGQLGAQHSTAFEAMYANIPGMVNAVRDMIKKMRKAWVAGNESMAVYSSTASGEPQFTLVSRLKGGLKEMEDGYRKPFTERYDAANGAGAFAKYLEDYAKNVESRWSELLFLRADLSSK